MRRLLVAAAISALIAGQVQAQSVTPGPASGSGSGSVTSVTAGAGATATPTTITTTGSIAVTNPSPSTSVSGDLLTFLNATGALQDSGTLLSSLPTIHGTITPGDCASWFSATALQDAGVSGCGGGGGGVPANLTLTNPASAATLTLIGGKTFTASNTLTLAGTDGTTMTFPSTSATIARTDVGQTFGGSNSFSGALSFGAGTPISVLALKAIIATAPSSPNASCGSTSAFSENNGTLSFNLTIGGTGITSVCTWTMPAASDTDGWHCWGSNLTTNGLYLDQSAAASTTSAAVTFYTRTTGVATAPNSGDKIKMSCLGN